MNTITPIPAAPSQGDLERILARLPALPSVIRYFDDYFEQTLTIREPDRDVWVIHHSGREHKVYFETFPGALRYLAKNLTAYGLCYLAAKTVHGYIQTLASAEPLQRLIVLSQEGPISVHEYWTPRFRSFDPLTASSLKFFLRFACDVGLGALHPDLKDFFAALRTPPKIKHRLIREGEVFFDVFEQKIIFEYLDLAASAADQRSFDQLWLDCVLACAVSHGVRPIQIAALRFAAVTVYKTDEVHIRYHQRKQRRSTVEKVMRRRVKSSYAPLYRAYHRLRAQQLAPGEVTDPQSLLGKPPGFISRAIRTLLEQLVGWGNATVLRHTAAQRLADAGASRLEIAEFLGHSDIESAQAYIDRSPTQAARLSKAMALSPVFSEIAEIARTKTINKNQLLGLPADNQIGALPHGIPIAGIGACRSGQSLCSKHPVLSCYGCPKFLPLNDKTVHVSVVESLRPVVRAFFDASGGVVDTPAYSQLSSVLTAAQQVVADIDDSRTEPLSDEALRRDLAGEQ